MAAYGHEQDHALARPSEQNPVGVSAERNFVGFLNVDPAVRGPGPEVA